VLFKNLILERFVRIVDFVPFDDVLIQIDNFESSCESAVSQFVFVRLENERHVLSCSQNWLWNGASAISRHLVVSIWPVEDHCRVVAAPGDVGQLNVEAASEAHSDRSIFRTCDVNPVVLVCKVFAVIPRHWNGPCVCLSKSEGDFLSECGVGRPDSVVCLKKRV
jgi:hypothetical protein